MYGAGIGLAIAIALYLTVPAYANFIQWQLQSPLLVLGGLTAGIALAVFTD